MRGQIWQDLMVVVHGSDKGWEASRRVVSVCEVETQAGTGLGKGKRQSVILTLEC